ncbi:MAG: hypothetical protein R3B13_00015, partial [Polyangiaceae bacterium]
AGQVHAEIRPEGYLAGVPRIGRNALWAWTGPADAFPPGVDLAQGQRTLELLPCGEKVSIRIAVGSAFEVSLVVPAGQSRSVRLPQVGAILITPRGGIGARFPDATTAVDLGQRLVRALPILDPTLVSRGARPENVRLIRATGASVGKEFIRTSGGSITGFAGASELALLEIDGEEEAVPVTLTVTDRGIMVTPRSE